MAALGHMPLTNEQLFIVIPMPPLPHPHPDPGNFVLLLDNGVRWWVAVIFNVVSSLMFWAGLIAAAILGDQLEVTGPWVGAILFGVYSYISLVNLVSEVMEILFSHMGNIYYM